MKLILCSLFCKRTQLAKAGSWMFETNQINMDPKSFLSILDLYQDSTLPSTQIESTMIFAVYERACLDNRLITKLSEGLRHHKAFARLLNGKLKIWNNLPNLIISLVPLAQHNSSSIVDATRFLIAMESINIQANVINHSYSSVTIVDLLAHSIARTHQDLIRGLFSSDKQLEYFEQLVNLPNTVTL
ncbi:hypothetical protein V6N13_137502 [Hibiscus sabdariffa]